MSDCRASRPFPPKSRPQILQPRNDNDVAKGDADDEGNAADGELCGLKSEIEKGGHELTSTVEADNETLGTTRLYLGDLVREAIE